LNPPLRPLIGIDTSQCARRTPDQKPRKDPWADGCLRALPLLSRRRSSRSVCSVHRCPHLHIPCNLTVANPRPTCPRRLSGRAAMEIYPDVSARVIPFGEWATQGRQSKTTWNAKTTDLVLRKLVRLGAFRNLNKFGRQLWKNLGCDGCAGSAASLIGVEEQDRFLDVLLEKVCLAAGE